MDWQHQRACLQLDARLHCAARCPNRGRCLRPLCLEALQPQHLSQSPPPLSAPTPACNASATTTLTIRDAVTIVPDAAHAYQRCATDLTSTLIYDVSMQGCARLFVEGGLCSGLNEDSGPHRDQCKDGSQRTNRSSAQCVWPTGPCRLPSFLKPFKPHPVSGPGGCHRRPHQRDRTNQLHVVVGRPQRLRQRRAVVRLCLCQQRDRRCSQPRVHGQWRCGTRTTQPLRAMHCTRRATCSRLSLKIPKAFPNTSTPALADSSVPASAITLPAPTYAAQPAVAIGVPVQALLLPTGLATTVNYQVRTSTGQW